MDIVVVVPEARSRPPAEVSPETGRCQAIRAGRAETSASATSAPEKVVAGEATAVTDRTNDAKSAGAFFTGVVSLGQDARGGIYMVNGNNSIYRLEPE